MRRIERNTDGGNMRIGVVLSRFNEEIGDGLLHGALRALTDAGVAERDVTLATVPGALEIPLALQRMAQSGEYHALIALGAVVRGETYHFEIVADESAAGVASVQLDFGIPVGNGILTTEDDAQALSRMDGKGYDAAMAAVEMANLVVAIDEAQ